MTIKENFLKDVNIGNRVELMIGSKEMDGIVVAIDLETVRIRRDNGKESVVSLDLISFYEIDNVIEKSETIIPEVEIEKVDNSEDISNTNDFDLIKANSLPESIVNENKHEDNEINIKENNSSHVSDGCETLVLSKNEETTTIDSQNESNSIVGDGGKGIILSDEGSKGICNQYNHLSRELYDLINSTDKKEDLLNYKFKTTLNSNYYDFETEIKKLNCFDEKTIQNIINMFSNGKYSDVLVVLNNSKVEQDELKNFDCLREYVNEVIKRREQNKQANIVENYYSKGIKAAVIEMNPDKGFKFFVKDICEKKDRKEVVFSLRWAFFSYYKIGELNRAYEISLLIKPYLRTVQPTYERNVVYKALLNLYFDLELWDEYICTLGELIEASSTHPVSAINSATTYIGKIANIAEDIRIEELFMEAISIATDYSLILRSIYSYLQLYNSESSVEEKIQRYLINENVRKSWETTKEKMQTIDVAERSIFEKEGQSIDQNSKIREIYKEASNEMNRDLRKAETLFRQVIEAGFSVDKAVANLVSIMIRVKDYDLAAMYLGKIGFFTMTQKSYFNIRKALLVCAPMLKKTIEGYELSEKNENALQSIPLSEKTLSIRQLNIIKKSTHNDEIEEFLIEAVEADGNNHKKRFIKELLNFYIRNNECDKALNCLFEKGIIYLSMKEYDLYVGRITSELPEGDIQDVMEKDEDEKNSIVIAQKAERIEKNIDKAIEYYKKSLNDREYMVVGFNNLVRIYNSLELFEEALELIKDVAKSTYIDKDVVLDMRIATIVKSKRVDWSSSLISTYNEKKELCKNFYEKNEIELKKANSLAELQSYELAAKYYQAYLKKSKKYLTTPKGLAKQKQTYTKLCSIYLYLNDEKKAKNVARDILEIDPEDEYAKKVLAGKESSDLESIEDYLEKENISDLILQKINDLSLETELKRKELVVNGLFMGSIEEATSIIKELSYQSAVSDEARSNTFFALAKMIGQILNRKDETIKNALVNEGKDKNALVSEEIYYYYIAKGALSYGNYQLYRNEFVDNYDSARYFYLQSIKVLSNDTFESVMNNACIVDACHKYILSFFDNRERIKAIRDNAHKNLSDIQLDTKLQEVKKVFSSSLLVTSRVLFAGIVELTRNNNAFCKKVVDILFESNKARELYETIYELCEVDNNEEDLKSIQFEDFNNSWNKARGKYLNNRLTFVKKLSLCLSNAFSVGELQSLVDKIRYDSFINYLTETDRSYIDEYIACFERLLRYNEITEYDYKVENLTTAEDTRSRLEDQIKEYPTAFSYDYLLPMVLQLKAVIYKESVVLFGGTKPEISVSLSGECAVDSEKMIVRTPIAFVNKNNVQNADNAVINIITPDGVELEEDIQLKRRLIAGNGTAYEEMISFRITDDVLEEKVFSIDIQVSYRYKKNMSESDDESILKSLTIPLYANEIFEPIVNKFEPHKNGAAVKDESMFYGRSNDIDNIIQRISDENGNVLRGRCLALYGQTRTGKSSILYHLEQKLRKKDKEGMIIINIGSIGDENLSDNDITEFLYTLIDVLLCELRSNHIDIFNDLSENGIVLDPNSILSDPERGQLHFNSQFRQFMRFIDDYRYKCNVIVMIDEFTYIYDWMRRGIMTSNFMKFWKAFIQNNNVFAIIVGQDHMMKFVNEKEYTNDFGSTDLKKVTYLNETDAKRLMDEPIKFVDSNGEISSRYKEGALDRLFELTCGSAFLIMNLCAGLVDYLNEIQSVYITTAHINEYLHNNLPYFEESRFFEPQYADKSELGESNIVEENKILLRKIAKYSDKKEWAPIKYVVTNEREKELLNNLIQRDVVIIDNNERCKIKVALYKEWILAKYGLETNNG